jgi:hypothetical protein
LRGGGDFYPAARALSRRPVVEARLGCDGLNARGRPSIESIQSRRTLLHDRRQRRTFDEAEQFFARSDRA